MITANTVELIRKETTNQEFESVDDAINYFAFAMKRRLQDGRTNIQTRHRKRSISV